MIVYLNINDMENGIVKVVYLEPVQASKETSWYEDLEVKMRTRFEAEYKKYVS